MLGKRQTEVLGENLPQFRFVHHKSHRPDPDSNPGRHGGKPATNRLSNGTACIQLKWSLYNYKFRTGSCMEGWERSRIIFFVISNVLALNPPENLQNTEMFLGVKGGRRVGLRTLPPSVSRLLRQCWIFDIPQPYRPPRPVTGITLFNYKNVKIIKYLIKPIQNIIASLNIRVLSIAVYRWKEGVEENSTHSTSRSTYMEAA
jgi:hypothetical protein